MKRRINTGVRSLDELRALAAIDAYNAGWRRGAAGKEPTGSPRYEHHPQFLVGYEDGRRHQQEETA